jgi:hypothetical protein
MSSNSYNFTQNVTRIEIARVQRKNSDFERYEADVFISGTFGSGLLTLEISGDNGTSFIPMKDPLTGNDISISAPRALQMELIRNAAGDGADTVVYATLTGATSPNIKLLVTDNN